MSINRAEEVRQKLAEAAATGKFNFGSRLAAMTGLSQSTVSRFRKGIYTGDNEAIARQLAPALASIEAARAIAGGEWRAAWLVKRGQSLRIVMKKATLEAIMKKSPDAHVVQVWVGPGREDLHFAKG